MNEFQANGEFQTPEEKRRAKINKQKHELARRKEAQGIDKDFGVERIEYLQREGKPLTKSEVGNRAVVISQSELDALGYVEFVFENGETTAIDSEDTCYGPDELLIIFPEQLGDLEEE